MFKSLILISHFPPKDSMFVRSRRLFCIATYPLGAHFIFSLLSGDRSSMSQSLLFLWQSQSEACGLIVHCMETVCISEHYGRFHSNGCKTKNNVPRSFLMKVGSGNETLVVTSHTYPFGSER